MKTKVYFISLITTTLLSLKISETDAQTFLLSESFESATFPPTGWVNLQGGTGNLWNRTNELSSAGSFSARYLTNATNAANAWLISPGINMIGGVTYTISYDQWVWNVLIPENLRVTIGTSQTIAGQTTVLQDLPGLLNIVVAARAVTFTPTVSGTYYIGWNCYSAANQGRLYIDNINVTQPTLLAPIPVFSNFAAVTTQSTSFINRRSSSARPKFTFTTLIGYNAMQIELNTKSDFTGTSYVSTFNNPAYWSPIINIDFRTTVALAPNQTYFVRARTSVTGGAIWGDWTIIQWPYSYFPGMAYSQEGWYYTTGQQFQNGIVQEPLYNFSVAPITANVDDANLSVNQGTFSTNALVADGVRENGVWYPANTYMTVGYQNNCNGNGPIFNGFPFILNIPNSAVINTANFSVVSTTDCLCETQNAPLQLIADAHSADNAPILGLTTVADLTGRTAAQQVFQYTTSWANDTRYTLTSVSNILQELVNRPGWLAGNSLNLLLRWNTAFTPGANNNRCMRQANNGATTAPRLDGTFTNFKNTVYFPTVDRGWYSLTSPSWNQLKVTDNTMCTSCYIEYRIHSAVTGLVLAGPFTRAAGQNGVQSFDISSVVAPLIFVSITTYRTNTSPYVSDFWLTANSPAPLPVTLESFNASCEDQTVRLSWSTGSEMNSSHFTVEKSTDMEHWTMAGNIAAKGNSTTQSDYELIDKDIVREITYYRLKQSDLNGETEIFDPVSVSCETVDFEAVIFPNPNTGEFTLEVLSSGFISDAPVSLSDLNGRVVYERSFKINPGTTHIAFQGIRLEKGVYVLNIGSGGGARKTLRLVVE